MLVLTNPRRAPRVRGSFVQRAFHSAIQSEQQNWLRAARNKETTHTRSSDQNVIAVTVPLLTATIGDCYQITAATIGDGYQFTAAAIGDGYQITTAPIDYQITAATIGGGYVQ